MPKMEGKKLIPNVYVINVIVRIVMQTRGKTFELFYSSGSIISDLLVFCYF